MNELRTLLILELRSLYGVNQLLHTHDRKQRNRYRLLAGVWIFLILLTFVYVGSLVYGLCSLGMAEIVPAYLAMASSLLILVFGLFTAGNRIFGQRGYCLLSSMPLRAGSIVLSRFGTVYLEDLLLTLLIFLPGTAVFGFCQHPGAVFYLVAILGVLFLPAIPLVLSTLFGTLILALSSRMKHKAMAQTVLMVLFVVVTLSVSFILPGTQDSEISPEQLVNLAQTIGDVIGKAYPPALWLGNAAIYGDLTELGRFLLVSAASAAITVIIVTRNFHKILRRLMNSSAKHNYKLGAMASRGLRKALYIREARRYFSSGIYVTNTIIGPIMGTILAIGLCVAGLEPPEASLPPVLPVRQLIPYFFAGVFCTMTTTSVAVSMEGAQFETIKSLPVPTKDWLDSKILLNLSLMLPFALVSLLALALGLKPDPAQLVNLVTVPASIMLFSVVFGITVNLKFHSFDWEKEEAVVKQSFSAMAGGFSGLLLALVMGAASVALPLELTGTLFSLIVLDVTWRLYRKNNQVILTDL